MAKKSVEFRLVLTIETDKEDANDAQVDACAMYKDLRADLTHYGFLSLTSITVIEADA